MITLLGFTTDVKYTRMYTTQGCTELESGPEWFLLIAVSCQVWETVKLGDYVISQTSTFKVTGNYIENEF